MNKVVILVLVYLLAAAGGSFTASNALYRCGIRRRFGVPLILHTHTAELGQWPWHVAIYHRIGGSSEYMCGGTLIDQQHVLTSAHCVINSQKQSLNAKKVSVQLGKHDLDQYPDQVQIVKASEIHVHREFSPNRNDVALVVLETIVRYSDYVIPICLERISSGWVHDLVGRRGSVAGWGITENGTVSNTLRTAQMLVVNNTECAQSDPTLFGRFISSATYCASDRNGTSVCRGDSGGGMFFDVGSHWELRGIVSFSGMGKGGRCDTNKYVVFTNVAHYYGWLKNLTNGEVEQQDDLPKRISEKKCLEYSKFTRKRGNGVCLNSRYPHVVGIIGEYEGDFLLKSTGTIISETFVLSVAQGSDTRYKPVRIRIGQQGDEDVKRIVVHPEQDLMLVEMAKKLSFNSRILPACLASEATENLYDTLILTGYSTAAQNQLYEGVNNRIISNDECNRQFRSHNHVINATAAHLCTINTYVRDDTHYVRMGFQGGPLQTANTRNCTFTVVGLVTNGLEIESGENHKQLVDVYTRVSTHLEWIEKVVWSANETQPVRDTAEDKEFERLYNMIVEKNRNEARKTSTESAPETTTLKAASVRPTQRFSSDFIFPVD